MISYNQAITANMQSILKLLKVSNLPFSDIHESPITFFVAKDDVKIIGCIGLEKYGNDGLLRSFAVDPEHRNKGIGKELYNMLLEYAKNNEITTLHLLTNTARDYFSREGHRLADRSNAPAKIAGCAEFAGLCPASSTYMVLETNL